MSAEGKVSPLPNDSFNNVCGVCLDKAAELRHHAAGSPPSKATKFNDEANWIVTQVEAARISHAQLVEAIERFLAAVDDSCDASPDHDDVRAMLEYGDSEKALRAALAAAKEGT